jgi:hypothetical protein
MWAAENDLGKPSLIINLWNYTQTSARVQAFSLLHIVEFTQIVGSTIADGQPWDRPFTVGEVPNSREYVHRSQD